MKNEEKKVTKPEEVKEEVKTKEKGTPLTDEEMAQVAAGLKKFQQQILADDFVTIDVTQGVQKYTSGEASFALMRGEK